MSAGVQCRRCGSVTPAPTKFCGTCGAPLVYVEEDVTVIAPAGPIPDEARRPSADEGRTVMDQPALDPAALAAHIASMQGAPPGRPANAPVIRGRDEMRTLLDPPRDELEAPVPKARPSMRTYIAGSTPPTADALPQFTTPEMQRPVELTRAPAIAAAVGAPDASSVQAPVIVGIPPARGASAAHAPVAPSRSAGPAGTERLQGLDPDVDVERPSSTAVFDYNDPNANPIAAPAMPGFAPPSTLPRGAPTARGAPGGPPPGAAGGAPAGAAPRPPVRTAQRTMLGMPSPVAGGPGAAPPRPPAPPPPRGPGGAMPGQQEPTIRGMPTPNDAPPSPASPPGRQVARTALGMAALPGGGAPGAVMRGPGASMDPMPPSAPGSTVDPPHGGPQQTAPSPTMELSNSMVGRMVAGQGPQPPLGRTGPLVDPRHEVPQGFGPPGAPPPFGQQAYAGGGDPGVVPTAGDPGLANMVMNAPEADPTPGAPLGPHIFPGAHPFSHPPGGAGFGEPSVDSLGGTGKAKKKGGRGCAVFLLVSGLALLLAAGGAFGYFFWIAPSSRRVTATVVRDAAGAEEIAVQVSGAPAGTKVRFAGQERVATGGRVRFPMPATQLRIGENRLSLEVLRPNRAAQSHNVQLVVDYRVRADLAGLTATPPAYEVVVDAAPGARVSVDGRAVLLDAAGHGTMRVVLSSVPVGADPTAPLVHTLRYRVEPNTGAPSDGVITTTIPRTTLTVDRPGPETITDRPTIEIAGGAEPNATVTIDGAPVVLEQGRFTLGRPLELGETNVTVRGTASGKAPTVTPLRIRRVADLEAEARAFPADAEVTYARLAVNPNLYRGRRAAFQGLVYNMRVEQGQTIIQLLVRDCPAGQRCALWVVFRGDTDATVGTQVRVLGTVGGEQMFRTPQGAQVTVPRLEAALVLAVRG